MAHPSDTRLRLRAGVKRALNAAGVDLYRRGTVDELQDALRRDAERYGQLLRRPEFAELPEVEGRFGLLSKLVGTGVCEGMYIVSQLHESLGVAGAVCEFGVGSGATSALLANEIRASDRDLWLFDTFSGLPAPSDEDRLIDDIDDLGSMDAYAGRMRHSAAEVERRLADIGFPPGRAKLVPGLIEDTLGRSPLPDSVAFAYVDFDFYRPIKAALEFLAGVMPVGAGVVVDDYGFFSSGAKQAVDEFLASAQGFAHHAPDDCEDKFIILRRQG